MQNNLEYIINRLDIIRLRQAPLLSENKFNIFRVLRPESDEVNLHSRFLHEVLNPDGSHGMGLTFLKLFADFCPLPFVDFENVEVLREHANIDILIRDNKRAVVIENKIYAIDQFEQLKRYHEHAIKSYRIPTLVYLTLDGKEPSEQSMGGLEEKVNLISYRSEINSWLSACIKECATYPALRETLIQYQLLIRHLSGYKVEDNTTEEVLNLMRQGDNAENIVVLFQNWVHVRWHTERDFWTELIALTELSYQVSSKDKFTEDELDTMIHGGANKNPDFGILLCMGSLYGAEIFFKIGRGAPVYYGIFYCSNEESVRARMRNAILSIDGAIETDENWAGWRNTKREINFPNFDNSTSTLQLVNPDKRQKIVGDLWQEIQGFINKSSEALQQEFGADFTPIILVS